MDWRRFKSIIIIVLIIINIFFLTYLIKIKISDGRVGNKTRNDVISVLKNSNIIMDENDFPKSRGEYSACYISRFLKSDIGFINKIIGSDGVFSEKDEVLTFKITPSEKTKLTREAVTDTCRSFMLKHGISSELYMPGKFEVSDNKAKLKFYLEYDECRFFDSYIDFKVSEKGIYELSGKNIVKAEENISSYEAELLPVESIIIAVVKDKKTQERVEVKKITFGYYLGDSADVYVSVLALPVWKIEFSDGDELYYDARNGNLIEI